jgi:hypothetical protein
MTDTALEQIKQAPMQAMQMIQVAFQKALESGGADALAVADRILEQMAKQRDYEDREAFNAALRRIQDKIKPIAKDCENKQTHSRYASAESVDNMLDKLIEEEHMTLSFVPRSSDKENEFVVVGILSLGAYSKEYPLPIPCDGKGPKGDGVMSRVHAVGSGVTYGKRYIKNMIFNLRFKEKDDDGNKAGGDRGELDQRARADLFDAIEAAQTVGEVTTRYIQALQTLTEIGAKDPGFKAAANKRKTELQRGN